MFIAPIRAAKSNRNGATLTSYAIVASFVFIAFAVVSIDLSMVADRRFELQAACDAAALAACAELQDPARLFPHTQHDTAMMANGRKQRLARLAREAAVKFARENTFGGEPVEIDSNPTNDPNGELVLGWVQDPADPTQDLIAWQGGPLLNSAEINLGKNRPRSVTMWAGQLLGFADNQIAASSRATLAQCVYGFQPAAGVPVPALPLVVDEKAWDRPGKPDHPHAGKHGPNGPDGIPEIVLTFGEGSGEKRKPANGWIAAMGDEKDLERQISFGLSVKDLEYLGGELALGGVVSVYTSPQGIYRAMKGIRGEKRILAIGTRHGRSAVITRFVAVEIGITYFNAGRRVNVVVQPCIMTSPTALVDASVDENPYIGKLMLTR